MAGSYSLRRDTRPDKAEEPDLTAWFGNNVHDGTAARAIERIATCISFDANSAVIKATPTLTGLNIIKRLLPYGHEYKQLDDDIQKLIRTNFTQARVEFTTVPGEKLTDIWLYDARLAYLACCREVPCFFGDTLERDTTPEYAGRSRKALYHIEVTVPANWHHIGLIPRRPQQYQQYWDWPHEPGETWTCWATNEEVQLLVDNAWPHVITERILFTESGPGTDPLRQFAEKMSERIMQLDAAIAKAPDNELILIRKGLRAIALHAIGYLSSSGSKKYRSLAPGEAIPEDLIHEPGFSLQRLPAGLQVSWNVPHTGMLGQYNHPEWASWIWAKNRVKLTRFALQHITRDTLLDIKTDAVYTSAKSATYTPTPAELARVGAYRIKQSAHMSKPMTRPTSSTDLATLITKNLVQEVNTHA